MNRLFVALAIAILAPIMAVSLVRDARSRKATEPSAPLKATAATSITHPDPPASATVAQGLGDPMPPLPVEHPLSEALCHADMVFVDAPAAAARDEGPDAGTGSACTGSADGERCTGAGRRLSFCIDRLEYPNVPGARPAMLLTLEMAEMACHQEQKRLCTDAEWTLACEGAPPGSDARRRAPGGGSGCNTGPAPVRIPVEKLWNAKELHRSVERYDGRSPSGSRSGCTSAFGVGDLTGNVSEWVHISPADGSGALKGGDFTGPPATCRAARRIGAPHYAAFAVGARCCGDPLVPPPRRR